MSAIVIGREYKKAYQSVRALVENKCVDPKVAALTADGGALTDGVHTFVYSDDVKGLRVRDGQSPDEGMGPDGAGWFAALRGGSRSDGGGAWLTFMEQVAAAYHKRYALVEYRRPERAFGDEELRRARGALRNIITQFFPRLADAEIAEGGRNESSEDIYGMSLRIALSGGTGASVPVLCKVYFRRRHASLWPLVREEADKIDAYLQSYLQTVSADGAPATDDSDASRTVDEAMGALDRLIGGKFEEGDFSQCVFFGREDAALVSELTAKVAHDDVRLECDEVRVLGISHVRWQNICYNVLLEGKPALRATVGLNDRISLECLACGGAPIVQNGTVVCVKPLSSGGEERVAYTPDASRADLGLTEAQLKDIRQYGPPAKHLLHPVCHEHPRVHCARTVCAAMLENFGTEQVPVLKCRDCPYPEIVFTDDNGVRRYTPALTFARDKMTLLARGETAVCACCGRRFSRDGMRGGLCLFCHDALFASDQALARAGAAYKRYAFVFSPAVRIKYAGRAKRCFEDGDILLFFMGEDKYVLDKLRIGEYGYIPKPVRQEGGETS